MPLTEENAKKKRVIAHEKGEYTSGDYTKYIVGNYPGGIKKMFYQKDNNPVLYNQKVDSLYNAAVPGGVKKMFESDAQRTVAGDVDDIYDDIVIDLSSEGAEDLLRTSLIGADEFVIYGHSSMGSYDGQGNMTKSPRYGGIYLDSLTEDIPEGCDVFLGACNSKYAGQAAANALDMPVTAQKGTASWTGAQAAQYTQDAFTRPVEGIFKETEERSQTYLPAIQ